MKTDAVRLRLLLTNVLLSRWSLEPSGIHTILCPASWPGLSVHLGDSAPSTLPFSAYTSPTYSFFFIFIFIIFIFIFTLPSSQLISHLYSSQYPSFFYCAEQSHCQSWGTSALIGDKFEAPSFKLRSIPRPHTRHNPRRCNVQCSHSTESISHRYAHPSSEVGGR